MYLLTVPPLPPLTDPNLLHLYWDNFWDAHKSTEGKELDPKKKPPFRDLELIGDAHLLLQARLQLRRMCGDQNWHMVKLLEEHAKGNPFLAQVGMHYKLNEWVRVPPCSSRPKEWADLVEAWIGAVMKERLLYDENDCFEELNWFLGRIWEIRYRGLKEYFLAVGATGSNEDIGMEIIEERPVVVPGDELVATVVDVTSAARTIGYQVSIKLSCHGVKQDSVWLGFGRSIAEAKKIAVREATSTEQCKAFLILLKD